MPTQLIRSHGESITTGSQASKGKDLVAAVPAGRTLLVWVVAKGSTTVASISKPGGETATWQRVTPAYPTGGSGVLCLELWAIKTTVEWASGAVVTATFTAAVDSPMVSIQEWLGLKTIASTAMRVAQTTNPITVSAAAESMLPGDVLITIAAVDSADNSSRRILNLGSSGTATFSSNPTPDYSYPAFPYDWRASLRASIVSTAGSYQTSWESGRILSDYSPSAYPKVAVLAVIPADDYPPYAPTITSMTGGVTLNRNRTNRLTWTFSSPNAIDNQSKADIRYRAAGSADAWTTITQTGTASLRDFTASTFAAGNYEIQVKTYGALGKESPWSALAYFTMADPPDGAIITYPIDGQTVDQLEHVTWSTPEQDAYQFRRLGDDPASPGTPDPDGVIYDSGEVTDTTTRTLPVTFAVNGRDEHLQVRVKVAGLWQDEWDSVRVEVSYTPPPTPTRVLYTDPGTASLLVEITNPEPTGDDPAAVNNEIWIDDGNGWERRAVGLPLNAVWRYWLPVSGRDYSTSIRVVAVAANGTTASST